MQELLEFACVVPLRTVYSTLEAQGGLKLLDDPLLLTATAEIVAGGCSLAWVLCEVWRVRSVLSGRRHPFPNSPQGFKAEKSIKQAQSRCTEARMICLRWGPGLINGCAFAAYERQWKDANSPHQIPVGDNSQATAPLQGKMSQRLHLFQSRATLNTSSFQQPAIVQRSWQLDLNTVHAQSSDVALPSTLWYVGPGSSTVKPLPHL